MNNKENPTQPKLTPDTQCLTPLAICLRKIGGAFAKDPCYMAKNRPLDVIFMLSSIAGLSKNGTKLATKLKKESLITKTDIVDVIKAAAQEDMPEFKVLPPLVDDLVANLPEDFAFNSKIVKGGRAIAEKIMQGMELKQKVKPKVIPPGGQFITPRISFPTKVEQVVEGCRGGKICPIKLKI